MKPPVDHFELLWRLYDDERTFARHHETQRTQAAGLVIAVSAGLIGFISFDNKINVADIPSAFLLIVLGIFGVVFTQKHYERTRLHLYRAYEYFHAIDALIKDVEIESLRNKANKINEERFGRLCQLKLSWLWMLLQVLISLTGVTMIYLILK